jgi:IclR family transcriptional regulator, mhp operon transcriptional activator
MNRAEGGWSDIRNLSAETGLHRTTVRRLLETLIADGLVRRSASDDSYRLTLEVRALSEGFTDDEWISQVATPVLGELLQQVVWPSDLTTLDGDAMVIRETTHRFSPLSFHRAMVRVRLPLLTTASGRAYLAFCPDEERRQLLQVLAGSPATAAMVRNKPFIDRMIETARAAGFATNVSEWLQEPKIAALAVPIFGAGQVMGCLNVVFLKRAMSIEQAQLNYLPYLRAAAEKISREMTPAPAQHG